MKKHLLKTSLGFLASCLFSLQLFAQIPPPPGGDPLDITQTALVKKISYQTTTNDNSPRSATKGTTQKTDIYNQQVKDTYSNLSPVEADYKKDYKKNRLSPNTLNEVTAISLPK